MGIWFCGDETTRKLTIVGWFLGENAAGPGPRCGWPGGASRRQDGQGTLEATRGVGMRGVRVEGGVGAG